MRHNAILLVIFATLNACSSETATYAEAGYDGVGGADSSASSTYAIAAPQAGGATAVAATTQAVDEVEPLCVPGQSVACACPDGASSAQVCAADGQSYGACDCGPSEVVEPAGYSGECVPIGLTDSCFINGIRRYAFINCAKIPAADEFQCVTSAPVVSGVLCCNAQKY